MNKINKSVRRWCCVHTVISLHIIKRFSSSVRAHHFLKPSSQYDNVGYTFVECLITTLGNQWISKDRVSKINKEHNISNNFYDLESSHFTVFAQKSYMSRKFKIFGRCQLVKALPPSKGISVRPSDLLPSWRTRPSGSLATGTPASTKARATRSFSIQW